MSVTATAEMLLGLTSQFNHRPMGGKTFKLSFRGLRLPMKMQDSFAGRTDPKNHNSNSMLVQGAVLASSAKQPLKQLKFHTTKSRKLKEGSPRKSLPLMQSTKHSTHGDLYPSLTCIIRYPLRHPLTECACPQTP